MNREEMQRLLEDYLDGTIGEADARLLAAAIRCGGEESAAVRRELELIGLIAQAAEGMDGEAFARSLEERRRAQGGEAHFLRALERRAARRASWRRAEVRRGMPAAAVVAAGLTIALASAAALWRYDRSRADERPVRTAMTPDEPLDQVPPVQDKRETRHVELPAPIQAPPPLRLAQPPQPPSPEPPAAPQPEPVTEDSTPPPPEPTRAVAAVTLSQAGGKVFISAGTERVPAGRLHEILPGQGVITSGPASRAVVVYADGTRLEIGPETWVRELIDPVRSTKRVNLGHGTLTAEVTRQPADRPMSFVTPHAEVRVLGTSLRLTVDAQTTLLEVREGRVRLARGGRTLDVGRDQYALAGPGLPLSARSTQPDEIVLLPYEARLTGNEWAMVRDPKASSGLALEAAHAPYRPTDHVERRPAWAAFSFYAADKEYRLWIRAASVATGDPWTRDMLTVEPLRAQLSRRSPFFGDAPTNAYVIDGISSAVGYSWVGSRAEEGKAYPPPLSVRFQQAGMQTLRLFTVHRSVRVDAIWLSSSHKARPAARQMPPSEER